MTAAANSTTDYDAPVNEAPAMSEGELGMKTTRRWTEPARIAAGGVVSAGLAAVFGLFAWRAWSVFLKPDTPEEAAALADMSSIAVVADVAIPFAVAVVCSTIAVFAAWLAAVSPYDIWRWRARRRASIAAS